jgi:hypothetical protein
VGYNENAAGKGFERKPSTYINLYWVDGFGFSVNQAQNE